MNLHTISTTEDAELLTWLNTFHKDYEAKIEAGRVLFLSRRHPERGWFNDETVEWWTTMRRRMEEIR